MRKVTFEKEIVRTWCWKKIKRVLSWDVSEKGRRHIHIFNLGGVLSLRFLWCLRGDDDWCLRCRLLCCWGGGWSRSQWGTAPAILDQIGGRLRSWTGFLTMSSHQWEFKKRERGKNEPRKIFRPLVLLTGRQKILKSPPGTSGLSRSDSRWVGHGFVELNSKTDWNLHQDWCSTPAMPCRPRTELPDSECQQNTLLKENWRNIQIS